MTEDHKARVKRAKRSIKYAHGFDEETLFELKHKSNLALLRALDGDISNSNSHQRRILVREKLIKIRDKNQTGIPRYMWTELGEKLRKELEDEK